jgi:multidrug efflux pump subunit AcrA (membrane-fusion protein)
MKNNKIYVMFISVLFILILVSCQSKSNNEVAPTDTVPISTSIVAEGKLLPVRTAELSFFPAGGKVADVNFLEGDQVKKGDILSKLVVTPQQTAAVTAAELELANAKNERQNFLDQAGVDKAQALMDVALAKERLKDASDKKRDKEYTYRFSKTPEAMIESDKAVADFNLATQQLALAEANALKWAKGPDADQLAILDARVKNADDQLNASNNTVTNQSVISAPFNGQIVVMNIIPDQVVQSGIPVITLADTNSWIVETTDLKEVNILSIKPGANAIVRVDAIPGENFTARVVSIQPLGVDQQGDITYKITLTLPTDSRFLWNMTTSVVFE